MDNIAHGVLDGGQWTAQSLRELCEFANLSVTSEETPAERLRGEGGGVNIVLCGNSQMFKAVWDIKSNRMVTSVHFVEVGPPPP